MGKISEKDIALIKQRIEKKDILWGNVQKVASSSRHGKYMSVALQDAIASVSYPCIIEKQEADAFFKKDTLGFLVGSRVPFVIIGIDAENGEVLASRREAQVLIRESMMKGLRSRRTYSGTIVGFVTYGAFVEVAGIVGLLKNIDYSSDHSSPREHGLREGDRIDVQCKSIDPAGLISWEAKDKVRRTEPFQCDLARGNIVEGVVIRSAVFPSGYSSFVNVAEGIDALCSCSPDVEVSDGSRVVVNIRMVEPAKDPTQPPRVRGKIIRVL